MSARQGLPRSGVVAAAAALAELVENWADDNAVYTCARMELFLIARRDPDVADELARARGAFREFAARWLEILSVGASIHTESPMAFVEGLAMSRLFHPSGRLSRGRLEAELKMMLRTITGLMA